VSKCQCTGECGLPHYGDADLGDEPFGEDDAVAGCELFDGDAIHRQPDGRWSSAEPEMGATGYHRVRIEAVVVPTSQGTHAAWMCQWCRAPLEAKLNSREAFDRCAVGRLPGL
jgi:hypothetical protein